MPSKRKKLLYNPKKYSLSEIYARLKQNMRKKEKARVYHGFQLPK